MAKFIVIYLIIASPVRDFLYTVQQSGEPIGLLDLELISSFQIAMN